MPRQRLIRSWSQNSLIARLQRHAVTNNNASEPTTRPALPHDTANNFQPVETENEIPNQSEAILLNSAHAVGSDPVDD